MQLACGRRALAATRCLLCVLAPASPAFAQRNPKLERLTLRPADQMLVRHALVGVAEISPGWTKLPQRPDDARPPGCRRAALDLSGFTITGQADAFFTDHRGDWLHARARAYASERQADSAFSSITDAARRCNVDAVTHRFFSAATTTVKLLAHDHSALPLGQHAVADQILASVTTGNKHGHLYVCAIDFVTDRYFATLVLTSTQARVNTLVLARIIERRLPADTPAA